MATERAIREAARSEPLMGSSLESTVCVKYLKPNILTSSHYMRVIYLTYFKLDMFSLIP
jgi:hypothetical protein